jgi:hypothetical protein
MWRATLSWPSSSSRQRAPSGRAQSSRGHPIPVRVCHSRNKAGLTPVLQVSALGWSCRKAFVLKAKLPALYRFQNRRPGLLAVVPLVRAWRRGCGRAVQPSAHVIGNSPQAVVIDAFPNLNTLRTLWISLPSLTGPQSLAMSARSRRKSSATRVSTRVSGRKTRMIREQVAKYSLAVRSVISPVERSACLWARNALHRSLPAGPPGGWPWERGRPGRRLSGHSTVPARSGRADHRGGSRSSGTCP